MVIICNAPYPASDEIYSIEAYMRPGWRLILSDFQKWAIKAIMEGDNVLITAHTGSGKTLPAEFAINYFVKKGQKVIYASPIKALSNQKLYDMRNKFPHISFGILTGDCKDNPEADVLIMTTEILRNTLLNKKINKKNTCEHAGSACGCMSLPLMFEMDFENELAAVVFDEVHYINDAERGSVWEQAILMLPPQVQLIMLSATIDRPEDFAGWIETEKSNQAQAQALGPTSRVKKMYLAPTYTRIVPLTHYMWLAANEGVLKKSAKTPYEKKIEELRGVPIPIATSDGVFNEPNYYKMKDVLDYLYKNNTHIKRPFVLGDLLRYLKAQAMLPAICFVFSRKHVEQAAQEISFSLFEEDSGLPALVEKECRHILSTKLANYQEYLDLPEYKMIVGLLEKGIAIHHAGIIPVLREMVELLFEKGFIRLLIATETFAVGLNMPTKTVIFAGLTKYNGSTMRQLYPHEYTQMAGRAGRRGIDTIGHVFHCVNLFELPSSTDYKHMLTGPPQKLTSKFKISFNLALSMLEAKQDMVGFMAQSMLSSDISREIKGYDKEAERQQDLILVKEEQLKLCRTPKPALERYYELQTMFGMLANAGKKKTRIEVNNMETEHKFLLAELPKLVALYDSQKEYAKVQYHKKNTIDYIANTISDLQTILMKNGFTYAVEANAVEANAVEANAVEANAVEANAVEANAITEKGRVAAQLQEVHPLAMTDLYFGTNRFAALGPAELAGLFSCFYPLNVSDELRTHTHRTALHEITLSMAERLDYYLKAEENALLLTGANYDIAYDLLPFVIRWCDSTDECECKHIIQEVKRYTGCFIGEFVKALLKVNAIAQEFERVCEMDNNMVLLEKLRAIPKLTLKYIATSQSLYL
jgi:superfamily II RNA helicase